MTTTVTTHSSSVRLARIGPLTTLATSEDSPSMSVKASMSLPPSPVSMTSMSGLLNSRNLDEKLVVATLATLNSGSASNLIKQDLRWIIQSRRKAEGKAELQVEFKKPVKDELTPEELKSRERRRELNRLAARRSRERGQKRKDLLVEEIRKLQSYNTELAGMLGELTEERNSIVVTLRQHMKQCSDYHATQSAAVGMSQRVLDLLGFHSLSSSKVQAHGLSDLYICTGDSSSSSQKSPSLTIKQEKFAFSSCPTSPLVHGFSGHFIDLKHTSLPAATVFCDDTSSNIFSLQSPTVSYSIPLSSPEFESVPLPTTVSRQPSCRSSTQSSDMSTVTSCSTADLDEEEEVIHYKHKLMKHRKQFSDPTDPSLAGGRGVRVGLERSFSFPSTVRESRSCLDSASPGSYMKELVQSGISGNRVPHLPTSAAYSSPCGQHEDESNPLDLAVKKAATSLYNNSQEKMLLASPMDTWPPAGMRTTGSLRNLERRWSLDANHSQPFPRPFNLSIDCVEEEAADILSTNCPFDRVRNDSKYSGLTINPYR